MTALRPGVVRAAAMLALAVVGCGPAKLPDPWVRASLDPYPNPFQPSEPEWAPQPHRDRPRAAALSSDGRTLYVALPGLEDVPGDEVAVVDVASRAVRRRIRVGRSPVALAFEPSGRFLVVANLLSNWASVIDTTRDEVTAEITVPWYTTAIAFAPDGRTAYLANRWKDSLLTWSTSVDDRGFHVDRPGYLDDPPDVPLGAKVGTNPDEVVVSADGQRVYVGSVAGGAVDVLAADGATPVGRIAVHSPIGGLALAGDWLLASHIGRGNGYPPTEGLDGDEDGRPGDGTANVMFQDMQNEIEVFDARSLSSVGLYTSDTICCRDYRDVDPDQPTRGLAIPSPETWPPERVSFLPPRDRWIVAGALPTRITRLGPPDAGRQRVLVVMSASDEAQRFDVDLATGTLTAVDAAPNLYPTGFGPVDVVARADGAAAFVVDRLGESVTVIDPRAAPDPRTPPSRIVVGDEGGGRFPATDVELGELFNALTSRVSVDGDLSCVHCHRDGGNLERTVAMPLQTNRLFGTRQVQAYRGAFDTRPWFLEAAMDQTNFFAVINEFSRKENFCCEEQDPLVWSKYPDVNTCVQQPSTPGCNHVLHCETNPPPECATRHYGSPFATRDAFYLDAAQKLVGRSTTFGDSLRLPGTDAPLPLTFDGITRTIGLFLLASPRLPPNPNRALALPGATRGQALYERPETGCASCHPLPVTTIAIEPDFNPLGLSLRLPPVITPTLSPEGKPADLVTEGFRQSFIVAGAGKIEQGPEGIHFGVPQLRGIWDRGDRFYHDGRARSLRSALLTPGHPALEPGDNGFNERYGVLDTHGGTSHLRPEQVDDLLQFLLSL